MNNKFWLSVFWVCWFTAAIFWTVKSYGSVYEQKPNVWVLEDGVGLEGEDYIPLITALTQADDGDIIIIILKNNPGGYVIEAEKIQYAMRYTKAIVMTTVVGQASSAALRILFSGDYILIPKDGTLMMNHLKYYIGKNGDKLRSASMVRSDRKKVTSHRQYLTADEYARLMGGEDVFLHGASICKNAYSVIVNTAEDCLIDGRVPGRP